MFLFCLSKWRRRIRALISHSIRRMHFHFHPISCCNLKLWGPADKVGAWQQQGPQKAFRRHTVSCYHEFHWKDQISPAHPSLISNPYIFINRRYVVTWGGYTRLHTEVRSGLKAHGTQAASNEFKFLAQFVLRGKGFKQLSSFLLLFIFYFFSFF